MRLPFTIEKLYTTKLSFNEIVQKLENKNSVKLFGGLRVDKYNHNIVNNRFYVKRYSNGIDALLEYFPLIKGELVNEKPSRIFLTVKPNYLTILFFSMFIFGFGYAGIFVDNWTINGVKRLPTITERVFIVLLGSGIPFLWCYVQYIRPIKRSEKWIIKKLDLTEQ